MRPSTSSAKRRDRTHRRTVRNSCAPHGFGLAWCVLDNARCVSTLGDALQDCVQVVGASARLRSMPLPHFDEPDDMAHQVIVNAHQAPVALVFGRERSGLTNDEIRCCTHQVSIPANPDYGILNLSQAVQILAYEVHRAWRRRDDSDFVYQRPLE